MNKVESLLMPTLTHCSYNNYFIFCCAFAERAIPKDAGFRWERNRCLWYTRDLAVAAKLKHHADELATAKLQRHFIRIEPWTRPVPAITERLLPHQRDAVQFALERNRCYLGLDPGLGKTAVAAVVAKAINWPVVYISPPFLVANVKNEFEKWSGAQVDVYADTTVERDFDPMLYPEETLFIVDEAHRFKNDRTKRAKAIFEILPRFKRTIFMSGTPIPNRPMEFFSVLSNAAPETIDFMNKFEFGRRYCAGYKGKFGWNFTGASNMKELSERVLHPTGPFMLRIRKNVLKLPPKLEEVLILSDSMPKKLASLEQAVTEKYADIEDMIKAQLAKAEDADDLHIATYRRLLGVHKAKAALPFIESILEETEESVVVFAHHKSAVSVLGEGLEKYGPLIIDGDMPTNQRQVFVDAFQSESKRRLLIGNITALGIGFTLTKATRCIFAEFDWVPGVNDQASDRLHRIGQNQTVLVQYLAFKNSIDLKVIEALVKKRSTLKHL